MHDGTLPLVVPLAHRMVRAPARNTNCPARCCTTQCCRPAVRRNAVNVIMIIRLPGLVANLLVVPSRTLQEARVGPCMQHPRLIAPLHCTAPAVHIRVTYRHNTTVQPPRRTKRRPPASRSQLACHTRYTDPSSTHAPRTAYTRLPSAAPRVHSNSGYLFSRSSRGWTMPFEYHYRTPAVTPSANKQLTEAAAAAHQLLALPLPLLP